MTVSWDTFERYRQKGLDARRAGQWDSARIYLLEAARAMVALSKEAKGEELKEARRQTAQRLLELAQDCQEAKKRGAGPRVQGSGRREKAEEKEGGDAHEWKVKEKPTLRF